MFKAALAVVAAIVACLLLWGVIAAIQWFTAPARGALSAREKIQADGNFRIQAYDSFFNQCADVQSLEVAIAASKAELATATTDREKARINTNITAQTLARADAVTQYNADSTKRYTVGQFKASGLPYRLSLTLPEGGTVCDVG